MKIKQNELKVLLGTDLGFPGNIVNSVTCDVNTIERPTEFLKHNKESNKIGFSFLLIPLPEIYKYLFWEKYKYELCFTGLRYSYFMSSLIFSSNWSSKPSLPCLSVTS